LQGIGLRPYRQKSRKNNQEREQYFFHCFGPLFSDQTTFLAIGLIGYKKAALVSEDGF
jgi:hypothetical protein